MIVPLALLAGYLLIRIDTIFRRGRLERANTRVKAVIALVAVLALISIVVWGFFHVTWYFWLAIVLALGFMGGLLAGGGGSLSLFWARIAPGLECFIIATAIYVWLYAR